MTLDKETGWRLHCIKLANEFSIECRKIQDSNPSQTASTIDTVIADLVTELWDQGFSQTEIRHAFKTAIEALSAYAADEERRS